MQKIRTIVGVVRAFASLAVSLLCGDVLECCPRCACTAFLILHNLARSLCWLQIYVEGQKAPLSFSIVCRLTGPTFRLTPARLDFGHALLHEQTGLDVQVVNESLLPQDIGEQAQWLCMQT